MKWKKTKRRKGIDVTATNEVLIYDGRKTINLNKTFFVYDGQFFLIEGPTPNRMLMDIWCWIQNGIDFPYQSILIHWHKEINGLEIDSIMNAVECVTRDENHHVIGVDFFDPPVFRFNQNQIIMDVGNIVYHHKNKFGVISEKFWEEK